MKEVNKSMFYIHIYLMIGTNHFNFIDNFNTIIAFFISLISDDCR